MINDEEISMPEAQFNLEAYKKLVVAKQPATRAKIDGLKCTGKYVSNYVISQISDNLSPEEGKTLVTLEILNYAEQNELSVDSVG